MPSTTATHSIALLSSRQVPGPNGQGHFFTAHTTCCSAAGRFDRAQQASLRHTKATAGELCAPPAGSRSRLGGTPTCPGTCRRPHKRSLATLASALALAPLVRQLAARLATVTTLALTLVQALQVTWQAVRGAEGMPGQGPLAARQAAHQALASVQSPATANLSWHGVQRSRAPELQGRHCVHHNTVVCTEPPITCRAVRASADV